LDTAANAQMASKGIRTFGVVVKVPDIADIDECLQQDICKGRMCSNIEGSFKCIECPRKAIYDQANNQCTRTKQQVLLIGIVTVVTK